MLVPLGPMREGSRGTEQGPASSPHTALLHLGCPHSLGGKLELGVPKLGCRQAGCWLQPVPWVS